MGCGCVSWIHLAQDSNEGRDVVNAVVNIVVP